jgi:hypothetical protein
MIRCSFALTEALKVTLSRLSVISDRLHMVRVNEVLEIDLVTSIATWLDVEKLRTRMKCLEVFDIELWLDSKARWKVELARGWRPSLGDFDTSDVLGSEF